MLKKMRGLYISKTDFFLRQVISYWSLEAVGRVLLQKFYHRAADPGFRSPGGMESLDPLFPGTRCQE